MKMTLARLMQSMTGAALTIAVIAGAQAPTAPPTAPAEAPAAPAAAPTPLSTFVLTGPLTWVPPATFDAGPLGKLSVNGILTGYAEGQNNPVPGDDTKQATLSNGLIFIQKADGKLQWFVQAGVYDLPTLGVPFANAQNTNNLYGPVPVAFAKLATGKTTSWEIGQLPTLMGAESTFTYQNFNINRGIVWNQETAISRGLQVNQTLGKYLTASLSWNDGYYSNRYNWLSGSLTFTKGPNTLVYDGMGNAGRTGYTTAATPLAQNNSQMHAVIYTFTKGTWIASAIYQYSNVPTNAKIGIVKGATTNGFAAYLSKSFKSGLALPLRFEYLEQSGKVGGTDVNLLGYGPGSSGVTFTASPTYQKGGLYFRTDFGVVDARNSTAGDVFGSTGTATNQFRAAGEFGFIFGNNIDEK